MAVAHHGVYRPQLSLYFGQAEEKSMNDFKTVIADLLINQAGDGF